MKQRLLTDGGGSKKREMFIWRNSERKPRNIISFNMFYCFRYTYMNGLYKRKKSFIYI